MKKWFIVDNSEIMRIFHSGCTVRSIMVFSEKPKFLPMYEYCSDTYAERDLINIKRQYRSFKDLSFKIITEQELLKEIEDFKLLKDIIE